MIFGRRLGYPGARRNPAPIVQAVAPDGDFVSRRDRADRHVTVGAISR